MKECENCAWSYHDKNNTVLCAKTEACLSHKFWKPDYPTLESENDVLKQELEVHKKALVLLCIDMEEIMDCPKNYPAFEEFLVNLNCKDCKDHDIFSDCWEKVYLAQARKELSHDQG